MSDVERIGALERVETMRRLHAEMLGYPKGSQERRLLEHQLAEVIRGATVHDVMQVDELWVSAEAVDFDPKKAAANDE